MSEEILRVQSRRMARAKRVQTAQHVVGAILLIITAAGHLTATESQHHHVLLPILEIAAGAVLIGNVIRERFSHGHGRVGWAEIAGSAMLFIEAIAKLQERHHALFYVLSFIPPLILLLFGIFDEKLRNGVYLRATEEFLEVRLRVFFPRRVRWSAVKRYRIAPKHLELFDETRRVKRFKISDIVDLPAAVAWAEDQLQRRGISAA